MCNAADSGGRVGAANIGAARVGTRAWRLRAPVDRGGDAPRATARYFALQRASARAHPAVACTARARAWRQRCRRSEGACVFAHRGAHFDLDGRAAPRRVGVGQRTRAALASCARTAGRVGQPRLWSTAARGAARLPAAVEGVATDALGGRLAHAVRVQRPPPPPPRLGHSARRTSCPSLPASPPTRGQRRRGAAAVACLRRRARSRSLRLAAAHVAHMLGRVSYEAARPPSCLTCGPTGRRRPITS